VEDRTDGELVVRWPIDSSAGAIIVTFNEMRMSVTAEGALKGHWFLELSKDKIASLPFGRIDRKKVSCIYKGFPYTISAEQGVFAGEPGLALRILPEDNRILLDFSSR